MAPVRRAAAWLAGALSLQSVCGFVAPSTAAAAAAAQPCQRCAPLRAAAATAATAAHTLDGKPLSGPMQPLGDTVIIKLTERKSTTEGGLFLPELKKVKVTTGTVTAVGPGRRHWETGQTYPMATKPGQKVLFGRYDGAEVSYDFQEYLLLRDDDCLLTFEGDKPNLDTVQLSSDRILVKVIKPIEQVKASGVVIAGSSKEFQENTGEVMQMGPGRMAPNGKLMPQHCAVGDFIKFRDFSAEWVEMEALKVEGQDFVVIKNTDVIAKW